MAVIQHRQTYKFAFKNKLQQLLYLSLPTLYSCDEMTQKPSTRGHRHKSNLPSDAYRSSHCLHMPSINWHCLDNILILFMIKPFKRHLIYNLSWKSNTWNVMPLALTKYLYMIYSIHYSFNLIHYNFFVSFSLTKDRTSTIGDNFPVKALWIHREW